MAHVKNTPRRAHHYALGSLRATRSTRVGWRADWASIGIRWGARLPRAHFVISAHGVQFIAPSVGPTNP
jgi:hypothetical protein